MALPFGHPQGGRVAMATVIQAIAHAFELWARCSGADWRDGARTHGATIAALVAAHLPDGAAFDYDESRVDRLIFALEFHHVDARGRGDGYTSHRVIVTPSLARGFDVSVTGRNRNDVRAHLWRTFTHALAQSLPDLEPTAEPLPASLEAGLAAAGLS